MKSSSEIHYRLHIGQRRRRLVLLSLVLLTAALGSLTIGAYPIALRDLWDLVPGDGEASLRYVLLHIRLPRTLAALLAGMALGVAGVAMQNVLRNPLASPFTLGVSQGAAFGAAFAIIVLGNRAADLSAASPAPHVTVLTAFVGSLVTVAFLVSLGSWRNVTPDGLILAGVALSSLFGAGTMLLQYFATDVQVSASVFWTFGDLGRSGWRELGGIALVVLPVTAWFSRCRWSFNAMPWGDDSAVSLGVNAAGLRLSTLVLAALVSAVVTAFLGVIGFVGLVAPHVMRMLLGEDHRFLLPGAALGGGLLLLLADMLARTVMAPMVLPVGILTAFAGAPLFLYLLARRGGLGR